MRPHSLPAADRAQESRESCKWRTYTLTRCKKHTCSNLDRKLPCSVFLGYAAWEISSCKLFSLFLSFMSSCGLILFLGFYASHQLSVNTCKLTGNTKAKLDVHAEKAVFFFFFIIAIIKFYFVFSAKTSQVHSAALDMQWIMWQTVFF